MLIGILETGRPPDELKDDYGSYANMFEQMLGAAAASLEFRIYAVLDDEFPASPADCDGWLITGSRHGVYENLPWMLRLQDFVRSVQQATVPMIGICFGHQIIAEALGGRVEKSDKGWGTGLQHYTLDKPLPWMDNVSAGRGLTLNAMHQDQVVQLPPGAEVIASSEFCEYAGLLYGDTILTFQPHPEFSSAYQQDLIKLRKGTVIPPPVADAALEELAAGETQPDAQVAHWMADFFTQRTHKTG